MPRRVVFVVAILLASASQTRAQGLRDQIRQLFTFGTCGEPLCLDIPLDTTPGAPNHGLHFIAATQASGGTTFSFLSSSIGSSVSNTPISSSSSGTTFRFEGGVPVKTSTSAGPIFGERAQTLGRGRWFVGLGFTQVKFERLRGVPLSNITFNFTHEDRPPLGVIGDPSFENDVIQVNVAMDVSLLIAAFSASYGLVDGIDLGVTIPFVRTSVSGQSVAQLFLIGVDTLHRFSGTGAAPVLIASSSTAGSASGLGDIQGRVKINLAQGGRIGVAVLADARFPTGDENNLLGAGRFSGRGLGVVSARFGDFNPHGYVGYTVRDAQQQTNSVEANAGFDQLLTPWATMAFDVLGSWQVGRSKIDVPPPVQYTVPEQRALDVTNLPSQRDDFLSMSIGFKFLTKRGIQIVTNALVPLKDAGLQPSVIWTGGLEYNF